MATKLDEMLLLLGELKAGQEHASEGRRVLHEKVESVADKQDQTNHILQQTNFALKVTTEIATQTRDQFNAFKKKYDEEAAPLLEGVSTFQEDAAPVLDQIKKARAAIMILVWVLGVLGVGTVGTLTLANDSAKAIVREWLEIEPPSSIPPIN